MEDDNFVIDLKTMEIYKQEVDDWFSHLNSVYGMVCFGFAVAVLGTPMPSLFALLSLPVIGTSYTNAKKFPPHITQLRQKAKNDKRYESAVKMIEGHFLSTRRVIREGIGLLIGFLSLFIVCLANLPHDITVIIDFLKKII